MSNVPACQANHGLNAQVRLGVRLRTDRKCPGRFPVRLRRHAIVPAATEKSMVHMPWGLSEGVGVRNLIKCPNNSWFTCPGDCLRGWG